MNPLLEANRVRKEFGGLVAVADVDFSIYPGQIKSIIGPNGAGKTTLFNVITGVYKPDGGHISFRGESIGGLKPYAIARRGISRTFQLVALFKNMSVVENVMLGRHCRTKAGMVGTGLWLKSARIEEQEIRADAMETLALVGLEDRADDPVLALPIRQQRLLEFARALATEPCLLLLDEPAAGLNVRETEEIGRLICRLRDRGLTILLVDHDMSLVMEISDEVVVLDYGKKVAEGAPARIQNDPKVIAVYLGQDIDDA